MAAIRGLERAMDDVSRRLNTWRENKRPGRAIPEELWQMAAEVAQKAGLYRTARTLRLHYGDLKKRLYALEEVAEDKPRASVALAVTQSSPPATFVEWLNPLPGPVGKCIMHVESRHGATMRVEFDQTMPAAIAVIIRDFAG